MPLIPDGQNLFVIDLEYIVPLEEVEPLMAGHMAFVNKCYENKIFLASGPKVPRTGGMVLAVAESRAVIEALIKEDPFHAENAVCYTITEFVPRGTAEGFK